MHAADYGLAAYQGAQAHARSVIESLDPADREPPPGADHTDLLIDTFRTSGLSRHVVEAQFGGTCTKVDPVAVCLIREALMNGSSTLDAMLTLQGAGSYALSLAGQPDLQHHWLPRIAEGQALVALALSEPQAGSDLKAVSTTIRTDGDEVVVSGRKSFISHASIADIITVFGREAAPGEGWSLVAVPADTPGLTIEKGPKLLAPHEVADVVFNDVRVPANHRIGAPGQAFELVLETLTVFRGSVAGSAVGLAQAALDEAVRHCRDRQQFGRPLYKHGPVAALLADSGAEVEMARLMAYRAAARARDRDGSADAAASALDYSTMAKLAASEAACRVVDRCVQAMGRFGLISGSRIGQLYLIARPLRIYEGASELLRLGVARHLIRELEASEHVAAPVSRSTGRSVRQLPAEARGSTLGRC